MSTLVTGLFVVQVLVGGYMFSYVLGAGQKSSNARATRIPDPVAVAHPLAAGVTVVSWLIHLASGERAFAWICVGLLLATAAGGLFMAFRTFTGGPTVDRPGRRQGVLDPGDPAEIRVAEKQIPTPVIVLHGATFLLLLVGTALVASGVLD